MKLRKQISMETALTESTLIFFVFYCALRFILKGQVPYVWERSVIFPGLEIVVLFYFISLIKWITQLEGLKSMRGVLFTMTGGFLVATLATLPLSGSMAYLHWVFLSVLILELPLLSFLQFSHGKHFSPQNSWMRNALRALQTGVLLWIQTIRGLWSLVGMICLYPWMTVLLKSAPSPDVDSNLAAWDQALFGGVNPLRLIEKLHSDAMSDWMALCYTIYGLYAVIVIAVLFFRKDQRAVRKAAFLLSTAFAVGYVGYTLFPALGPMYTQEFAFDLHFQYLDSIKTQFMDVPRINRDCFPSLHTCITFLLTWISWKEIRPLFWVFLPVTLTMPFACVYLRYHYVADVLAGTLLCVLILGWDALLRKKFMHRLKSFPALKENLYF